MTKSKLLNIGLLISSLIVYFEWGGDHSTFLYKIEWDLMAKTLSEPTSLLHPFIILPFIGQILLLVTLFQKQSSRKLSLIGMILLGFLIYFVFVIGIFALNFKISGLAFPYVLLSFMSVKHHRMRSSG
ncbi:hypothetical protein [Ekhidna sp.]